MTSGKHVVLGVTGGIAAYKACEVASRLVKMGVLVDVIMTENATKMVAPLTFETLTKNPVVVDTFERVHSFDVKHISLAQKADLFVIAPATANIIAKMAHGIADDMVSTTVLATKAPILVAPAMNTGMWTAEATKDNVQTLLRRGVHLVGPDSGMLACGDVGAGRMSEPSEIMQAVETLLYPKQDMKGLSVLVTAGASVERIDPVRYLTNDSSGKMGFCLAENAKQRGAKVTLLMGKVQVAPPSGVEIVPFDSTQDLLQKMVALCPVQDIIVQAAAPGDYRVKNLSDQKIKKSDDQPLVLTLVENPDVAKTVGQNKQPHQVFVGFAAETQKVTEHAKQKLSKKHLDMIVANDVTKEGAGFGCDTNIATLITNDQMKDLPMMTKSALAECIFDEALAIKMKK